MKKIKLKNIIGLVLIAYIIVMIFRQQVIISNIKHQEKSTSASLAEAKQKNKKLKEEVKISNTDSYLEKLAREKLGYIKDGETPIINNK